MMKRAGRVHGVWALGLTTVLILLGWGYGWLRAVTLRDKLLGVPLAEVSDVISQLEFYRLWVNPLLRQEYYRAGVAGMDHERLHAGLALLPVDPKSVVPYLEDRMLRAEPQDIKIICDILASHQETIKADCWRVLTEQKPEDRGKELQAASALALYDPNNPLWEKIRIDVANRLVAVNAYVVARWIDALRPVAHRLRDPLIVIFQDEKRRDSERTLAANALAEYLPDQPRILKDLLMESNEARFVVLYPPVARQADQTAPLLEIELSRKPPSITGKDTHRRGQQSMGQFLQATSKRSDSVDPYGTIGADMAIVEAQSRSQSAKLLGQ